MTDAEFTLFVTTHDGLIAVVAAIAAAAVIAFMFWNTRGPLTRP